ncbi:MAG: methyl-accepting chemotaxis protein [Rhodospirillales bacterium]
MKFKLSLFHVFLLLALIALIGVATLSGISATTMRDTMLNDRQDKVKQTVLGVDSIVRAELAKQKKGELTEAEAKARITDVLRTYRYDGTNYIFAIGYDYCVLAHSNAKVIGTCKQLPRRGIFTEIAKAGGGFSRYKGPKPGFEGDKFDKVSYIHPVPEMNMYIGTGAYFDDINDAYQKRLLQLGGIGLAIITVIVAFGSLVGRSVSKALRTLSSRMSELAEGKLDVMLDISSFVREVDEMIGSVKIFRTELERNRKLEAEKIQLEKKAEEDRRQATLQLAEEFDASVGEIVKAVGNSAGEMDTTATLMSTAANQATEQAIGVAAAAEQASRNTASVASATEELSSSIEEIARQVQKASEVANQAVNESQMANEKVSGLAEAVGKVGQVVTLITDIAEQTNLLALNATIEAARAGDAGKGFAVVASEVKNLASQTAKATEEISQQIAGIQQATNSSVGAIGNIGATIDEINTISATIAAAIEEQGVATQEISRSVHEASAGTDQVTENIANVRQSSEETGRSADQVKTAANGLAELAATLQSQVDRFLAGVRA